MLPVPAPSLCLIGRTDFAAHLARQQEYVYKLRSALLDSATIAQQPEETRATLSAKGAHDVQI